jgi:hypothetical protein
LGIFSLCAAIQQGGNQRICQHDKTAATKLGCGGNFICYDLLFLL